MIRSEVAVNASRVASRPGTVDRQVVGCPLEQDVTEALLLDAIPHATPDRPPALRALGRFQVSISSCNPKADHAVDSKIGVECVAREARHYQLLTELLPCSRLS